jgi:hypothetical protein
MRHAPRLLALLIAACVAGCDDARESDSSGSPAVAASARAFAASEPSGTRGTDGWSRTEQVQADVKAFLEALYAGDFEAVLEHTHPILFAAMGGREAALEAVRAGISPLLEKGLRVESFGFPREPEFVPGGKTLFAIVPTLMVVELNGRRVESLNYQFGILESDVEDWKYVEGSRIDNDNVRLLFPDFPEGFEFPETYRRLL